MARKKPMPGPGFYQWNTGGWFGSQIGCTAWMLGGFIECMFRSAPWLAFWCLVGFAAVNAFSTWLWWRRNGLAPFPALLLQLLACVIGGALVVALVSFLGFDMMPGHERLRIVLILVGLTAWFGFSEWRFRRQRSRLSGPKLSEVALSSPGGLWDRDLDSGSAS